MPFQSEEQRRFMWANHPEIARKWTNKYGGAVQRRLEKNQSVHSEKSSGKRNVYKRKKRSAD